jgi:hypothetical protein
MSAILHDRALVVLTMSEAKRRTPIVVVRDPRTAPMSADDRQQAITALAVMIHEWWSGDQGRSANAVRGSDQSGGAAGGPAVNWSGHASTYGR